MFFDDADRRDFCVYEIYTLSLAHTLIHYILVHQAKHQYNNNKSPPIKLQRQSPTHVEQITYEIDTKKVQTLLTKPSSAPQPLPLAVQMVEKGKK